MDCTQQSNGKESQWDRYRSHNSVNCTEFCSPFRIIYTLAEQQIGRIDIRMVRDDGILCSAIDPTVLGNTELRELSGNGVVEVTYEPLQLTTGKYVAIVRVTDPSDCVVMASGQSRPFHVHEKHSVPEPGVYMPLVHWSEYGTGS